MLKILKNNVSRFDLLKAKIKVQREAYWEAKKEEMFSPEHKNFYYRGKPISRKKCEYLFNKYVEKILLD